MHPLKNQVNAVGHLLKKMHINTKKKKKKLCTHQQNLFVPNKGASRACSHHFSSETERKEKEEAPKLLILPLIPGGAG